MDTLAKGERLRGVRAPEIKRLWLWEDGGVAAGCGEPEEELCALRQVDVAEGDRPLCHAPPDWDGRVVTERLVYGTGDQLRVGRPQARPARWPHQSLSCGQSRSGMPTKLKMIVAGSGNVSEETRSNGANGSTASKSRSTVARIRGSISATRRGVNARAVGERRRVCAGGSRLTIDGCGWCPPADKICAASGTS